MQNTILTEVNAIGYSCTTTFNGPIPQLEMIKLPLYLEVRSLGEILSDSNGRKFFPQDESYQVTGVVENHEVFNDWVKPLKFDYCPNGNEKGELQEDWFYIYFDHLINVIKIYVNVYYRKIHIPRKFIIINEQGLLAKGKIDEDGDFMQQSCHKYANYTYDQIKNQDKLLIVPYN